MSQIINMDRNSQKWKKPILISTISYAIIVLIALFGELLEEKNIFDSARMFLVFFVLTFYIWVPLIFFWNNYLNKTIKTPSGVFLLLQYINIILSALILYYALNKYSEGFLGIVIIQFFHIFYLVNIIIFFIIRLLHRKKTAIAPIEEITINNQAAEDKEIKYNPFTMWGSWIGFTFGLILYDFVEIFLSTFLRTVFITLLNINLLNYFLVILDICPDDCHYFFSFTNSIMYFVYGWGIHSLVRKIKSYKN